MCCVRVCDKLMTLEVAVQPSWTEGRKKKRLFFLLLLLLLLPLGEIERERERGCFMVGVAWRDWNMKRTEKKTFSARLATSHSNQMHLFFSLFVFFVFVFFLQRLFPSHAIRPLTKKTRGPPKTSGKRSTSRRGFFSFFPVFCFIVYDFVTSSFFFFFFHFFVPLSIHEIK